MNKITEVKKFFEENVRNEKLYYHSLRVAVTAAEIGEHLKIDRDALYCYGLLHDIGKINGSMGLRHVLDGYNILNKIEVCDRSNICLTHSFPNKRIESYMGENDCTESEYSFIKNYLEKSNYDIYDKIIQLCDAIAGATGCKILEISMVDVAFKYKVNEATVKSWKAYYDIYEFLNQKLGKNVYSIISEKVKGYDFY